MDINALLGGGGSTEPKLPLEQSQEKATDTAFEDLLGQAQVQSQDQKKAELLSKDGKNLSEAMKTEPQVAKTKQGAVAGKNAVVANLENAGVEKNAVVASNTATPTFSAAKALAQENAEKNLAAQAMPKNVAQPKVRDYAEIDPRLKDRRLSAAATSAETSAALSAMQAQAQAQAQVQTQAMPMAAVAMQNESTPSVLPTRGQPKPVEQALASNAKAVPAALAKQQAPVSVPAPQQQQAIAKQVATNKAQRDLLLNPRKDHSQVADQKLNQPQIPQPQTNLNGMNLQQQIPQTTTVVAQPIVIQMPMAIPVEVLGADIDGDDDMLVPADYRQDARSALMGVLGGGVEAQQLGRASAWNDSVATAWNSPVAAKAAPSKVMPHSGEVLRAQKSLQALEEKVTHGNSHGSAQDMSLYMPHILSSGLSEPAYASKLDISAAGRSEGLRAALDVANPEVVAAFVGGLANQGGGSVKLKITPEHLGELTISVEGRGKNLNVRMEASSAEAKEVLAQSLPELKHALAANRYDVASIEINAAFSDRSSGAGHEQSQRQNQNQPGMAWEKFFEQRDQSGQHSGGRRGGAYRQYQQFAQDA